MVTGESKPVGKRNGDAVISGTVNGSAPLIVKVAPIRLSHAHTILRLLQSFSLTLECARLKPLLWSNDQGEGSAGLYFM